MALPATETFTGSDGDQLAASDSWTDISGQMHIQSNAVASDAIAAESPMCVWDDDIFGDNQYSEATVVAIADRFIGLCVRSKSPDTGYTWMADNADAGYIDKFINAVHTSLESTGSVFAVSNVIRMEINGESITCKINGGTDLTHEDSSIANGSAGVAGYQSHTTSRIDDWEGGDLIAPPLSIRAVRQAVNTSTGTQNFDVSGWDADVQAALYIATYATADDSAADHSVIGLGLATSSSERHTGGARSEHGTALQDSSRRTISDECIVILDPADGSVDGEADFVQFNSGGSQVNWGVAPSAAFLMTALYFSGFDNVDLQKVDFTATGGSPQTVTVGFEPNIVILVSTNGGNTDTVHNNSELGMGIATWDGDAVIQQGHLVGFDLNGNASGLPRRGMSNAAIWGGSGAASWAYTVVVESFTSTGFDIALDVGTPDSTDDWFVLSLELPSDLSAWLGNIESPTSTGTDAQTGPGFTPQALIGLLGYHDTINNWENGTADAGPWGVSVATASEEFCHAVANEQGSVEMDTQSLVDSTLINLPTDAGAAGLEAYLDSFDANGWTPYYTVVDSGTPRQQLWLAIEEDAGGVSASASESASASASESASASASGSASGSPSPSPGITGEVCWGHITGVLEANVRTFAGNWAGTGAIESSGDPEQLALESGEVMSSEMVNTGVVTVQLLQNEYDPSGDDVTLRYRHGATPNACAAASWNPYTVTFESLGYVEVQVESTL